MKDVVIYTRRMCGYCSAAIRLLEKKGVPYSEIDATGDPAMRAEMSARSGGRATFPQIFIGDIHVGGCDELFELDYSGELADLLNS